MAEPVSPVTGRRALAEEFLHLKKLCDVQGATFGDLLRELSGRGHALVILFFVAPFLVPVPTLGLSTVLGLFIMYLGVQIALGLEPRLPEKWAKRELPREFLEKVFNAAAKVASKTEKIVKPRLLGLCRRAEFRVVNGVCVFILAFCMTLPFPPGTNAPPAFGLALLSIGMLEEDGFLLVAAYIATVLNAVLFTAIGIGGAKIVEYVTGWFH